VMMSFICDNNGKWKKRQTTWYIICDLQFDGGLLTLLLGTPSGGWCFTVRLWQ
jgi:hypothetical protein